MFTFEIRGATQEYQHVKSEEEAANIIIDDLGIDKSLFEYVKPCENYSTIQYKGYDLFRIKYTDKSKWIQILMTNNVINEYKDSKLFEAEKNKNKAFWKSNINDLLDYKELLLKVIERINALKKRLGITLVFIISSKYIYEFISSMVFFKVGLCFLFPGIVEFFIFL